MMPTKDINLKTAKINFKYTMNMDSILEKELKDSEFKKAYKEELLKYEVAKMVRQTRKAKHLSQSKLAKQASTTQNIISKVERGDVNIGLTLLHRIATALDLRISILRR
jgi:ribosome-binding protein aMBF1 (putative translation factor)